MRIRSAQQCFRSRISARTRLAFRAEIASQAVRLVSATMSRRRFR